VIDVLIAGTIHNETRERVGDDGRTRVRMYLVATDGSGRPQYVICTATNPDLRAAMLRTRIGDSVSVTGHATVTIHQKGGGSDRAATLQVAATGLLTIRNDFDNIDELDEHNHD
jgi:hypothetical protein